MCRNISLASMWPQSTGLDTCSWEPWVANSIQYTDKRGISLLIPLMDRGGRRFTGEDEPSVVLCYCRATEAARNPHQPWLELAWLPVSSTVSKPSTYSCCSLLPDQAVEALRLSGKWGEGPPLYSREDLNSPIYFS